VLQWVADAFADPAIDAVYGNLQYVDPLNTDKVLRHWRAGAFHRNKFYQGWMPPHPGFFVRKRLYNEFGVFNTALRSAADYEIMLRFLFKHEAKAAYVDKLLVKMRSGGMSNASLRNRLRANSEDRQAWRLNGLKPRFYTLTLKPLRKINQYFIK
jgi:glycosyltransferase